MMQQLAMATLFAVATVASDNIRRRMMPLP